MARTFVTKGAGSESAGITILFMCKSGDVDRGGGGGARYT